MALKCVWFTRCILLYKSICVLRQHESAVARNFSLGHNGSAAFYGSLIEAPMETECGEGVSGAGADAPSPEIFF